MTPRYFWCEGCKKDTSSMGGTWHRGVKGYCGYCLLEENKRLKEKLRRLRMAAQEYHYLVKFHLHVSDVKLLEAQLMEALAETSEAA